MVLQRKTFKHNPTSRINPDTGMVDLTIGGQVFDLDPEQAAFLGVSLKENGERAKGMFKAPGYKPEPEDEHTPQDIDALEAADGIGDGSWAIPQEAV